MELEQSLMYEVEREEDIVCIMKICTFEVDAKVTVSKGSQCSSLICLGNFSNIALL